MQPARRSRRAAFLLVRRRKPLALKVAISTIAQGVPRNGKGSGLPSDGLPEPSPTVVVHYLLQGMVGRSR
jgi:hypothetical protein